MLQRLLNGVASLQNAGANSPQGGGRVVADLSVGQDAASKAVCRSRKSASVEACAASRGNLAASSRNCRRSQLEVSSNESASRNSRGSSTTPGPSSCASHASGSASAPNPSSRAARSHSRASRISAKRIRVRRDRCQVQCADRRRPGAQVVRSRSSSRSLSNSRTSCADRDIFVNASLFARPGTSRLLAGGGGMDEVATGFAPTRNFGEARGPSSTSRTRSRMGCQKLPRIATGLAPSPTCSAFPKRRQVRPGCRFHLYTQRTRRPVESIRIAALARFSCALRHQSIYWLHAQKIPR